MDPAVVQYFNATFHAFSPGWGPTATQMQSLGVHYDIVYDKGADAWVASQLRARAPAFFFLYSPHQLLAQFELNRIQLPTYSVARFAKGVGDFPLDVLEKARHTTATRVVLYATRLSWQVASRNLAEIAPSALALLGRFEIDNAVQESIMASIDVERGSAIQASCAWLRNEQNRATWQAWLPPFSCQVGEFVVDADERYPERCQRCPKGFSSARGLKCTPCAAGTAPCVDRCLA